jgi:hypothetical protein
MTEIECNTQKVRKNSKNPLKCSYLKTLQLYDPVDENNIIIWNRCKLPPEKQCIRQTRDKMCAIDLECGRPRHTFNRNESEPALVTVEASG